MEYLTGGPRSDVKKHTLEDNFYIILSLKVSVLSTQSPFAASLNRHRISKHPFTFLRMQCKDNLVNASSHS